MRGARHSPTPSPFCRCHLCAKPLVLNMPERVAYNVGKHALLPANDESRAVMAGLKVGDTVHVEVYQIRDQKFSNCVNTVFDRIGKAKGMRVRNVRGMLAILTGRADLVAMPPGFAWPVCPIPHGTGPRDMNAVQFEVFWEDSREVVLRDILPTLVPEDAADIVRMIESMRL